MIEGVQYRNRSSNENDNVVLVYKFADANDHENKERRFFELPPDGKWDDALNSCRRPGCIKWHAESVHANGIRPPVIDESSLRRPSYRPSLLWRADSLGLGHGVLQLPVAAAAAAAAAAPAALPEMDVAYC